MCAAKENPIPKATLSIIWSNSLDNITERNQNRFLRPIFINGVEVGFAYSQGTSVVKKLNARGITITLWYFISRGHQAQALLPFCFKTYPNKLNGWDELMALYRMNLVEFTPGYGADKYVEVNRIMAMRTREYGGCMVARSQMHAIVEQNPILDQIVEKKLLMPSFNGSDLIFPLDGPLGRNGLTFADTIICRAKDPEWSRCISQQMSLSDQRIWMTNLASLTQISPWKEIAEKVCRYRPKKIVTIPAEQLSKNVILELHPSETNPPDNRGFSKLRNRRHTAQETFEGGQQKRTGRRNNGRDYFSRGRRNFVISNTNDDDSYFIPSYRQNLNNQRDENKVEYIGRPNSLYRLCPLSRASSSTDCSKDGYSERKKQEPKKPPWEQITNYRTKHNQSKTAHKNAKKGKSKGSGPEVIKDGRKKRKEKEENGAKRTFQHSPPILIFQYDSRKSIAKKVEKPKAICMTREVGPEQSGETTSFSIISERQTKTPSSTSSEYDDTDEINTAAIDSEDDNLIYFSD